MAERKLVVQIVGDSKQLERTFARSSRAAGTFGKNVERAGRGGLVATVGFRGLGRSIAFASGAFLGGAGFIAGTRAALRAASDLSEEINKSNVLFGKNADEVRRWSRTTATAIGLSQRASLQAAGAFGAMFSTLRLGDDVSSRMSRRLVKLGADLASFSNQNPEEMLDRLRSGLAGEAEPLRRFGILISAARVEQEAYRSGIAATGETLTEQQKVLARFNLILRDSGKAQGDFARTSTSQANQERINAALREEAAKRIGQVLLPAYNQATRAVNRWLGEERNMAKVQQATSRALEIGTKVARAFRDVAQTLSPILQRMNSALGGTESTVKLLLAALVASKVISFGGAVTGLGSQALVATGRVNALRFALLRLGALAVVTVAIEVILNRKAIHERVTDLLSDLKRGVTGAQVQIPIAVSVPQLENVRAKMAALKGDSDIQVVVLDKIIARLQVVDQQNLRKIQANVGKLRKSLDGVKEVEVSVVEKGIERILEQLAGIKNKTVEMEVREKGLQDLQLRLAQVRDKTVEVAFVDRGLDAIQAKINRLTGRTIEIAVTTTETQRRAAARSGGIAGQISSFFEGVPGMIDDLIHRIEVLAKSSKVKAAKAFDDLMASLARDLTAAGATVSEADNLRILQQQLAAVQSQIRIQGRTKDLLDQQAEISAQIVVTQRSITESAQDAAAEAQATAKAEKEASEARARATREQAAANRKANQFEKLGLTREGAVRVPGVGSLRARRTKLAEQIKGTVLDTAKTQAQLERIRKVLTGKFVKVGRDVRAAILQMLNDIASALEGGGTGKKGPLTKTSGLNTKKILEGIGLSPEQIRELRGRLSSFNTAGRTPAGAQNLPTGGGFTGGTGFVVENYVTVQVGNQKLVGVVTKEQQKTKRRNPKQKRGPNRNR